MQYSKGILFFLCLLICITSIVCDEKSDKKQAPTVTTASITSITITTASGGGDVTADGGADITARGVCWSTSPNPTIEDSHTTEGSEIGSFTSSITGLSPNTTYYVKAYATNDVGTSYGNQVTFTTNPILVPTVTTTAITNITSTSASAGGDVTADGGAPVTARGVCWKTSANPTITDSITSNGTGTGAFVSSMGNLLPNTTYYVKAYATNNVGTSYGSEMSFTTAQVITDVDGNIYHSVTIGTQVWMVENLRTTKYRDGTAIANVTDNAAWGALTTGAYCNYNNDVNNATTYGHLYNWHAVNDVRNIAPAGWHVATDAEWTALTTYLGGELIAGGKLKEAGLTHWASPNTGATNETGFTALPGGVRMTNGSFNGICSYGLWWSSTEYNASSAWELALRSDNAWTSRFLEYKVTGQSIRCIKD